MYVIAGISSNVEACGWWGDGETGGMPLRETDDSVVDPVEQTRIGDLFRKGETVNRDYMLAVYWYRKAAEQGFAGAQNNLGNMYEEGLGVPKDELEASKWFQRAAEKGNSYSQHSLGSMYLEGRGVTENFDEAVKWFQKAAVGGHHSAFNDLGEMYWNGLSVPKNYVMAYMWWKLGIIHGDKKSEKMHKIILEKMEPGEVSEAEKKAGDWMRKYR